MSRTAGHYVKLWRQGLSNAEEPTQAEQRHLMAGTEPPLVMVRSQAAEAGQAYAEDKTELTYALEPATR